MYKTLDLMFSCCKPPDLRGLGLVCLLLQSPTTRPPDIPFRMHAIDPGASETAAVADFNRDGRLDILSGDSWYEAPRSTPPREERAAGAPRSTPPREERAAGAPRWRKHRFRDLPFSNNYVDDFSDLALDVDGDGYPDIVTVTWFSKKISWYRNPGARGGLWAETTINSGFNVEFAVLADMNNDGRAHEIVAQENGTGQAWYEVVKGTWVKHVVSDRSYGHGIGTGDVNGDKRTDILTPRGWLEAPADPRSGDWTFHSAWESVNTPVTPRETAKPSAAPPVAELGFMHVLDVNGDGRSDVVTAAGHDYGVFWFEQLADGKWARRTIDAAWSQGHASTAADLNGDGRLDLITGKRFMAHNGSDPGEREPLGIYWYEYRNGQTGGVEWIRHLVDYGGRIGAGMQIPVVDLDGDGDPDIVCPGKSGLFLAENLTN